jgi:hypothetical protein
MSAVKVASNVSVAIVANATGTLFSFTTPDIQNLSSLRLLLFIHTSLIPAWYNRIYQVDYSLVGGGVTYASFSLSKYVAFAEMGGVMPYTVVLNGEVPCNTLLSLTVKLPTQMSMDAKCITNAVAVYSASP